MVKKKKPCNNSQQYGYCSIHGKQPGYPGRTDCHVKDTTSKNGVFCGKRLTTNQIDEH